MSQLETQVKDLTLALQQLIDQSVAVADLTALTAGLQDDDVIVVNVDSSGQTLKAKVSDLKLAIIALDGSGTTNFVTKWIDADTVGDSTIFDDGNNVGIGTTSPSEILQVGNDSVGSNYIQIAKKDNSDAGIKISGTGVGRIGFFRVNQGEDLEIGTESTNDVDIFTNGVSRVTIDASGNVGIGTTSPSEKLEVAGGHIRLADAYSLQWGSANNRIYNQSNSTVFINNANERMRITSAGSVGIGTTNPIGGLHVANDGDGIWVSDIYEGITASDSAYLKQSGDTTYLVNGNSGSLRLGTNNFNNMFTIASSGNVLIGTTTPTSAKLLVDHTNTTLLELKRSGNTKFKFIADSNHAQVDLYNSATTSTVRLRALGDSYFNGGNLGIGTTSPSEKLDVEGNVIIRPLNTTDTITFLNLGSNQSRLVTTNNFAIFNGSIETARFLNTGGFKLAEYGSGTFTGTATQRLGVDTSGNVIEIPIGSGAVDGSGTANYITKWSDADTITDSVIFDNGTNVGIGTTAPTGNLHVVKGTVNTYPTPSTNADLFILENKNAGNYEGGGMTIFTDNGGNGNIYFGDEQSNQVVGITCDNMNGKSDLFFTTNGNNERLRIDSSGNVGIGTTSPGQKLHVLGEGKIQGNLMIGSSGDVAGAVGQLHIKGSNDQSIVLEDTDNANLLVKLSAEESVGFKIEDTTNSNVLFFGDELGNVGIGTDSPLRKLEVNGIQGWSVGANVEKAYLNPTSTGTDFKLNGDNGNIKFDSRAGSNSYINTGNLGIGTTSPLARLNVVANSSTGIIQIIEGGATYGATTKYKRGGSYSWQVGIGASATGNDIPYSSFGIVEEATSRLVIAVGGNVGIGTIAPTQKLEVADGYILASGSSNAHGFELKRDSADTYQIRHLDGGLTIFNATDSRKEMTFDGLGKVGIGITAPSGDLHLVGDTGSATRFYISDADEGTAASLSGLLMQSAANTYLYNRNNGSLRLGTNDDTAMLVIANTGKVGIGTTSPSAQLHSNISGGSINYGMFTLDTNAWLNFFTGTGIAPSAAVSGQGALYWKSNTVFRLGTSTSTAGAGFVDMVRIDENGNVGIGTNAPEALLDISSTTNGVLLPRMTTTQVNAISSPSTGLTVYNTTLNTLCFYNGSSWQKLNHATM